MNIKSETKLPESLTLKLEVTITLEEITEYIGIPLEDVNIEVMKAHLREYAHEIIDFNKIEGADIFNDNGEQVS